MHLKYLNLNALSFAKVVPFKKQIKYNEESSDATKKRLNETHF